MNHNCSRSSRALGITMALIFSVIAYADGDLPKPTSAADIGSNVRSFLGNLGKGVTIRKPYEEYDIVSQGVVPGRGPGYCLKGEPMPHLNSAPNQVSLALVPCKTLEESGQFQRVVKATTSASPAGATRDGDANADAAIDLSKQCTYLQKAVGDGTGDQWCMMRDGMVIGRVHWVPKPGGNNVQEFTRFEKPISIGILTAGGSVGSDGKVVLPADVQAGWDKVDHMKDEGAARVKADMAANQAANADKSMIRKAAMEKCKPLIKGGDAQMTAFKACFRDATK